MKWINLSREQGDLYKAVAILMIVVHNFMHWLPGPKEMEFSFENGKFLYFFEAVGNEPLRLFQFLMSFFGHFGVQVFIFLSAYGLTKKYLINKPNYFSFIASRFSNIYPTFVLAILFWALIVADFSNGILAPLKVLYWNLEGLIYKLSLLSNFFPTERLSIVGPWWFISFIFQVYFVFPLLFAFQQKTGTKGLVGVAILSFALMVSTTGSIGNVNLSFTIIGHLPEICLGMYLASRDQEAIVIKPSILFIVAIVYILGNFFETFWFFTHVTFLILLLFLFQLFIPKIPRFRFVNTFLVYIGVISMHLFLVNGFLRRSLVDFAIDLNHWSIAILLCILSLCISIIVAHVLSKSMQIITKTVQYLKSKSSIFG